jgi:hypothetical protein
MPKMLEQKELDLITGLVEMEVGGELNPRNWFLRTVQDADLMLNLVITDKVGVLVENAVHLCDESAWNQDPPLMLRLVRALPETPPIAAVKRKLSDRPKPARDPFTSRVLITRIPLLNRESFRNAVRKLIPLYGKCILTINGPKKCGKSYTFEYVQHLSAHLTGRGDGFRIVRVALEGGVGSTYTPDVLAGDVVARMERSPLSMPNQQTPMAKWINYLTNWVFSEAALTGDRWWWVLDGFCAPDLNLDTRKFVQSIMNRVVEGEHAKRVRLILLDYPEQLPNDIRHRAHDEPLSPPSAIGELDVREVFVELNDDENLGLTDAQITEITSRVMTGLPTAEEKWLEALRNRINGEIDALVA